jgi:hypothetical protein
VRGGFLTRRLSSDAQTSRHRECSGKLVWVQRAERPCLRDVRLAEAFFAAFFTREGRRDTEPWWPALCFLPSTSSSKPSRRFPVIPRSEAFSRPVANLPRVCQFSSAPSLMEQLTIRWKLVSELLLSRVCHIGYCRDDSHDLLPIQV